MSVNRLSFVVAASIAFSACSAIEKPELISEDVLPLDVLTATINCELKNAVYDQLAHNPWLDKWQGQYAITLKANHIAYIKSAASVFPIVLPKSNLLNLGISGGYTSTANRTGLLKFNINFHDVAQGPRCARPARADGHPFLYGEIGFKGWIDRAIRASGVQTDKANPDKLNSIGHTFEFIVDWNAGVSPSFVLMPTPSVLINPTASFDRVEDNIVDVSFGKIPPATATISDIVKVLSKPQKMAQVADRKRLTELNAAIEKKGEVLDNPAKRELLGLNAKIAQETAQLAVRNQMQIQSFGEDGNVQKKDDKGAQKPNERNAQQKREIESLFEQLKADQERAKKEHDNIEKFQTIVEKGEKAEHEIVLVQARIASIDANPELTRTTTRQTRVPGTVLTPETNPNVTNTLLQLQLERLVGNRLLGQ